MDKKNRFELTCLSRTIPDFTARLFRAAYKSGDALMSPLSVYAALSMARAGAAQLLWEALPSRMAFRPCFRR